MAQGPAMLASQLSKLVYDMGSQFGYHNPGQHEFANRGSDSAQSMIAAERERLAKKEQEEKEKGALGGNIGKVVGGIGGFMAGGPVGAGIGAGIGQGVGTEIGGGDFNASDSIDAGLQGYSMGGQYKDWRQAKNIANNEAEMMQGAVEPVGTPTIKSRESGMMQRAMEPLAQERNPMMMQGSQKLMPQMPQMDLSGKLALGGLAALAGGMLNSRPATYTSMGHQQASQGPLDKMMHPPDPTLRGNAAMTNMVRQNPSPAQQQQLAEREKPFIERLFNFPKQPTPYGHNSFPGRF